MNRHQRARADRTGIPLALVRPAPSTVDERWRGAMTVTDAWGNTETVIVTRQGEQVWLSPYGSWRFTLQMTPAEAGELIGLLRAAAAG